MFLLDIIQDYIRFPYIIAGLAVGGLTLYTREKDHRVVYVYPNSKNIDRIQYKDLTGQCFEVIQEPVPCNTVSKFGELTTHLRKVLPQM